MEISTTPEPKLKESEGASTTYTNKISLEEYTKQKDDFTQKALKELSEQMKTFEKPKQTNSDIKPKKLATKTAHKSEHKLEHKSVPKTEHNIINVNNKINTKLINNNNDDNDDDDNDDNDGDNNSESDYDNLENTDKMTAHPAINLIVQHVENKQKKRKVSHTQSKNQDNSSMSDSIYAQHEVDMQTIQLLKDKMNELKIENADLDGKKHYLTLDLNNAQCDINQFKKQVSYLKAQLITHKQFINQMKKYDDDFAKRLKLTCAIIVFLLILYTLNS